MAELSSDFNKLKIAMLIDGDNAQPKLIGKMLAETGKYGSITIRRIYGDWTTANMNGWKEILHSYAIQPIQQFSYTIGKNATDSAMIIDAMDILHGRLVDGFCLVSSDSDYTRLATRIRQEGFFVMGIGKRQTPEAFVKACDLFVNTEILSPEKSKPKIKSESKTKKTKKPEIPKTPDPIPLLKEAFQMSVGEDGWANLAAMGLSLRQLDPSFDPRTYGYNQLNQLISAYSQYFEQKKQEFETGSVFYVRQNDYENSFSNAT